MRLANFLRICLLLVSVMAVLQFLDAFDEVHAGQRIAHGFGAHFGDKRLRAVGFARFAVFVFVEQLMGFERRIARVNDQVIFIIDDALQMAGGHVQRQPDAGGHALEKPDMANGHGQFDMAHALAAHAGEGHFHAATIADDAAVFDALEFAAGAFPVFDRAENAFAEQAAFFGLERAVIDGFGVFYFAFAPGTDGIRGGNSDSDIIYLVNLVQS